MSTYNPNPRGILLQPINRSVNAPGQPAINYFMCVFDVPDSWGALTFNDGAADAETNTITFTITTPGFVFPSANLPPSTTFQTTLFKLFTKQQYNLVTVKVKDTAGTVKSGTIINSTPVKADIFSDADDLNEEGELVATKRDGTAPAVNQCRPFVIKNASRADQFFVGAFALTPATGGYGNQFKSMTKEASPSKNLVCDYETSTLTKSVAACGVIKSTLDEFDKVKIKNISDPNLMGTFNYTSPTIISV